MSGKVTEKKRRKNLHVPLFERYDPTVYAFCEVLAVPTLPLDLNPVMNTLKMNI